MYKSPFLYKYERFTGKNNRAAIFVPNTESCLKCAELIHLRIHLKYFQNGTFWRSRKGAGVQTPMQDPLPIVAPPILMISDIEIIKGGWYPILIYSTKHIYIFLNIFWSFVNSMQMWIKWMPLLVHGNRGIL